MSSMEYSSSTTEPLPIVYSLPINHHTESTTIFPYEPNFILKIVSACIMAKRLEARIRSSSPMISVWQFIS
jgi:hypothetical protein